MGDKTAYEFNEAGIFVGSQPWPIDPLETERDGEVRYLRHPRRVEDAPPEFGDREIPVRVEDEWVVYEDRRGELWYREDGIVCVIDFVGPPAARGLLPRPPDEDVSDPVDPDALPSTLTIRQIIIGMVMDDLITVQEGEAWAQRNALPAVLTLVIDALPEDERPLARITALTMTMAETDDALLLGVAAAVGLTDAQREDALRRWSVR